MPANGRWDLIRRLKLKLGNNGEKYFNFQIKTLIMLTVLYASQML